jgi:D-lactate dehydrogenase
MTRAPASVSSSELRNSLVRITSQERVLTRPIELIAFAADVSFYRLVPKAVALTNGAEEIKALFRFSHESHIPLTFRAAGTSLCGKPLPTAFWSRWRATGAL